MFVVGLDCASPAVAFDHFRDLMPNLTRLRDAGIWGPMASTVPPITVPAWTSMVSGRDPGELGCYGFRNRVAGTATHRIASSSDVTVPRVWDWLGEAGKRVAVLFVPQTWPPSPVNGHMVSGMLTPDPTARWAYPFSLQNELEARFGAYQIDVEDFRRLGKGALVDKLCAMARQHFAMARYLWREKSPDFLMMVEVGLDRLHHALWPVIDPGSKVDPGGSDAELARRYYALLDDELGSVLDLVGEETAVMVVSDHGARSLQGGLRINEWLQQQGWLALEGPARRVASLAEAGVDWSRTRAWAEGGYYARIMLNVAGREHHGVVPQAEYEQLRTQLAEELASMTGPDGQPLGNRVVRPESVYREVRGVPPDLLLFVGDLAWRSLGTVGGDLYTAGNDSGPDGCNHDWQGIWVLRAPGLEGRGPVGGLTIYDVAPTVLGLMGYDVPKELLGVDRSRAELPR